MADMDIFEETPTNSPLPNPRKRPRPDEEATEDSAADSSIEGGNVGDDAPPSSKRSRSATKAIGNGAARGQWKSPGPRKSSRMSPRPARQTDRTPRPSKFAEGSMNDKPSKKPPSLYIRDDEAMEEYMAEASNSKPSTARPSQDSNTMFDAGIEQDRPSTMFRFGKAFASVFNPISVWTGRWKSKEPQANPEQMIFQERQVKAQKAYADLKKSGYTGTQSAVTTKGSDNASSTQSDGAPSSSQTASFRDSAVDVEEYRMSVENKEDTHVSDSDRNIMPAPSVPFVQRSVSPMPRVTGRRSSLNLHTPSLSTLKRVGSHLQLPSAKRNSAQESVRSSTDSVATTVDGQSIRKQPSRKDLAKQKKLYKRVSNLESQLEAARRELGEFEATNDTTDDESTHVMRSRPKAFVPGALPSLPSERTLKDHIPNNNNQPVILNTTEQPTRLKLVHHKHSAGRPSQRHSVPVLFPNLPTPSKRTNGQRIEDILNPVEDQPKPRQSSRTEPTTTSQNTSPYRNHGDSSRRTPSRNRHTATAPPVPSLPPPFQLCQVDKPMIMTKRPYGRYHLPFGHDPMDAINTRKVYPLISDAQLSELIPLHQPQPTKQPDLTSTTHLNHAPTPQLSPPRSPSPASGAFKPSISRSSLRSRTQKVPNNSPTSVRKQTRQDEFAEIAAQAAKETSAEIEDRDRVAPLNETAMKGLPPYPKNPGATVPSPSPNKGGKGMDKPLPGIQKEEFDWGEDVF